MLQYLIDGNNLIWKIPELKKLQKNESERTAAREKLLYKLQRHFAGKKVQVTVFFDGAPHAKLGGAVKTKYSYERKADELILEAIDALKTKHTATIVSSDRGITDYAKVNGCKIIKSEQFAETLAKKGTGENKEEIAKNMQNEDWESIFGTSENERFN